MKTPKLILGMLIALVFAGNAGAQVVDTDHVVNVQFATNVSGSTPLNGTSWSSAVSPIQYIGSVWTEATTSMTGSNLAYADSTQGNSTIGYSWVLHSGSTGSQAETYESLSLLKSTLYTGAASSTLTFSGLNPVLAYNIAIAAGTNFGADNFTINSGPTVSTTVTTQSTWVNGQNYVNFLAVVPSGSGTIVVNMTPVSGLYGYTVLNGFQIAADKQSTTQIDITQPPYNAVTSTADNGPVFQSAINNLLAAGGGVLYIPTGNWTFTTPISVTATTGGTLIIRGDGPHAKTLSGGTDLIYKTYNGTNAITFNGSANPANFPRICIRDLAIDGGTSSQMGVPLNLGNGNGLVLEYANNFELSGVTIGGFAADNVLVENSSYGSIRDADIAFGGVGVDCLSAQSLQLDSIQCHYLQTAAFRDPPAVIGVTTESNYAGYVLDANSPTYVSLHDTYCEMNHLSGSQEEADIQGPSSGSPTICLSIGGYASWNFSVPSSYPYHRLWGTFAVVDRIGASRWSYDTNYAALDVTNTIFLDGSNEMYPTNLTWTTATGNSYQWHFQPQTISNFLP